MKINLIVLILLLFSSLQSVSFVYNLKLAETTMRHSLKHSINNPRTSSFTFVEMNRKKETGDKENVIGGLASFIYSAKDFYVRGDFGIGNVSETKQSNNERFSRTQVDDILFTGGYRFIVNKYSKLTFSGLFGIPTHKNGYFEGIQFGIGNIGLGGQMDGSYAYTKSLNHMIVNAARLIHFFESTLSTKINNGARWFDLHPGNLVDLLIGNNSTWGDHTLEVGYVFTFTFGGKIFPKLPDFKDQVSLMISSFYSTYSFKCLMNKMPTSLLVGLAYGIGLNKKDYRYKSSLSAWLNFSFKF